MQEMRPLFSTTTKVEIPYIMVTIGEYIFGVIDKTVASQNDYIIRDKNIFPNYIENLNIQKLNGQINTYTLNMIYTVQKGEDPNFFEKVFSSVSSTREIKLSYGDLSVVNYIYKEEAAIITNITSSFNFRTSTIRYTLTCVSKALQLNAGTYALGGKTVKPSDEIKRLLKEKRYGLQEIFTGMRNYSIAESFIASDDKEVYIEPKSNINILSYLNYLVNCMSSYTDNSSNSLINTTKYTLTIYDDINNEYGGSYFRVDKVSKNIQNTNSINAYRIDVGFPVNSSVIDFQIQDSQTYSILYDYSEKISQTNYGYRINDEGKIVTVYQPIIAKNDSELKTTEAYKSWWSKMTQYPIKATLSLRGLIKPATIMQYLYINNVMWGRKHYSSGYYIITKQTDNISSNGFNTVLELVKIQGDDEE